MPSRRHFLGFFGASAAGAAFFQAQSPWHPPLPGEASAASTATGPATASAAPAAAASAVASAAPTATPTAELASTVRTASATTAMPIGTMVSNGTTWIQTYAEDFARDAPVGKVQAAYPKMGYYKSGRDTSGYGYYAPDYVLSVQNSMLDFHLRTISGYPVAASILPDNYAPHVHARVSVRYRADPITGFKFVGMLWPSSNVWNNGEIDWPEGNLTGHVRPASAVAGSMGYGKGGGPVFLPPTEMFAATDQTQFHVVTTEWTSDAVRFYWDGTLVAKVTQGVPTQPMRVTLQAETWQNAGPPPAASDGHVEIDWVVIYKAQ
jgi:hypothetical protein